jgi:hypothetical protein
MKLFSWIFRTQSKERRSSSDWRSELTGRPDWMLENIVRNTGEFTVEMRTAAQEILAQRKAQP